ncbi:MAG: hypothetical protein R2818_01590 [Flavobacteriales bacterium]
MRNFEFVGECSDIDDIIVFRNDGTMLVTKVADKKFIGKGILHVGVWKKNDDRMIYHMIYQDGTKGRVLHEALRRHGITRDKEYDLTNGTAGSTVQYFTANPDGAAEVAVQIQAKAPRPNLRKTKFDVDFSKLAVKGRGSKGNLLTRYMVSKITQKRTGWKHLGCDAIQFDETVRHLNDTGHGRYLGRFAGEDRILAVLHRTALPI